VENSLFILFYTLHVACKHGTVLVSSAIFIAGGWTSEECFIVVKSTTLLSLFCVCIIDPTTRSFNIASDKKVWVIGALPFANRIAGCRTIAKGCFILTTFLVAQGNPITGSWGFAIVSVFRIIGACNATGVTGCGTSKFCPAIK
jgi:hypothetical protein